MGLHHPRAAHPPHALLTVWACGEGSQVSAAKVDRDPQVARSRAERVEAIGPTHLLNPGERWPSCDLDVMSHHAAQGLDGRCAVRWTLKL